MLPRASLLSLLIALSFFVTEARAQQVDTLVDVGGYSLHFTLLPGTGTPILFESGNSYDGPAWGGMLSAIREATDAPLIMYDRSGFGESELNPGSTDPADFGILNGMREVESALISLGFDDDLMLVGHSYGAFYSALFAARHPDRVKSVVLVNAHLPQYWTEERLSGLPEPEPQQNATDLASYYVGKNFLETARLVAKNPIPESIPVVDLVAGLPIYFMSDDDFADWNRAHREFATTRPNTESITAHGSGHYIFQDDPMLFFNAVLRAYADTQPPERRLEILRRGIDETIEMASSAPAQ